MCGRFSRIQGIDVILDKFDLKSGSDMQPSYNIAPKTIIAAILQETPNMFSSLLWGMVPSWSKSKHMPYSYINVRAEGIMEKKTTTRLIQSQRCIIPASGFYEWKKDGRKKIPYYFTANDQPLFGFAGLYSRWVGGGEELLSCAIITTEPNEVVKEIHDRMPVILLSENIYAWLNSDLNNLNLKKVLQPYPADRMVKYQVDTLVNSVSNDNPLLITPMEERHKASIDDFF